VSDDYGEQVVEIVSDAACQLTNGLHFVDLPQLVLRGPSLLYLQVQLLIYQKYSLGFFGQIAGSNAIHVRIHEWNCTQRGL
jgi:hypothetical protein